MKVCRNGVTLTQQTMTLPKMPSNVKLGAPRLLQSGYEHLQLLPTAAIVYRPCLQHVQGISPQLVEAQTHAARATTAALLLQYVDTPA